MTEHPFRLRRIELRDPVAARGSAVAGGDPGPVVDPAHGGPAPGSARADGSGLKVPVDGSDDHARHRNVADALNRHRRTIENRPPPGIAS